MSDWIMRIRAKIGNELTFTTGAGAWIENEHGMILLQRRAKEGEVWGFPGGVMELGEAAHETAIREVKEETGLDVTPTSLLGVYTKYFATFPNGDQCQCVTFMYRMQKVGGAFAVDNIETFELRYFSPDELPSLYHSMHRQILQDGLAGGGPYFR